MKLIATILLAASLQASTISFTSTATDTSTANGNSITFSGLLGIQQFDPSLGTLNSMSFLLHHTGQLYQDVTMGSTGWYQDYIVSGTLSFLGVTENIWTDEMYLPCVSVGPCVSRTNVSYFNGVYMDAMNGSVTAESDTFQRWASGQGYVNFATHPSDLNMFLGTGAILLPVESNLVARFAGGSALLPEQTAGWWASIQYGYTPSPVQASVSEIAITPEPFYGVIIAIATVLMFFGKHLTRKHQTHCYSCGAVSRLHLSSDGNCVCGLCAVASHLHSKN